MATTKKSKQPAASDTPAAPAVPAKKPAAKAPAKASKPAVQKTAPSAAQSAEAAPAAPAASPAAVPAAGDKWYEIRQLLLSLKEQTLLEIKRSIRKGSEAAVGEEPTGDIYDQASSERDRELGLLLNDRERDKLHNIDEALLRITEGDYGICEECDEEIPLGRLKVLPFTRHCVKCKSDLEKIQAQTRRIEEDRVYREIPVGEEDEG